MTGTLSYSIPVSKRLVYIRCAALHSLLTDRIPRRDRIDVQDVCRETGGTGKLLLLRLLPGRGGLPMVRKPRSMTQQAPPSIVCGVQL